VLNGWQYLNEADRTRIERGIVENAVYGGPWHIELQPTNLCNLNCKFCISRGGRHGESLDWPALRRFLIENSRRDLRMLRLTGGGEPLLYEQIRPLIDTCGELGILLENITTNGTLLSPLAGQIVRAGLGWLTVSLNEPDAARYAATMRTSERSFDQAVEGVRALVEARDAAPPERRGVCWGGTECFRENFSRFFRARARALSKKGKGRKGRKGPQGPIGLIFVHRCEAAGFVNNPSSPSRSSPVLALPRRGAP